MVTRVSIPYLAKLHNNTFLLTCLKSKGILLELSLEKTLLQTMVKHLNSFTTNEKETTKESHMDPLGQHYPSITLSSLATPTTWCHIVKGTNLFDITTIPNTSISMCIHPQIKTLLQIIHLMRILCSTFSSKTLEQLLNPPLQSKTSS